MNARELNEYLISRCEVDLPGKKLVDRIVIGDPETPVKKVGTCWQPYGETLHRAHDAGVNVMVVHEPTFYHHLDLDAAELPYPETADEKRAWIEERGMVIIRCHDMIDAVQSKYGMPFAWGRGMGFTDDQLVYKELFFNFYAVDPPASAAVVARRIAAELSKVGQQGVAFYGDDERPVASVGVGTGCYANPNRLKNRKPDMFVAIDDSIQTWCQTTHAIDTGQPLVVVNHGTSEEFGMAALGQHLSETFSEFETEHFTQGCGYRWLTA